MPVDSGVTITLQRQSAYGTDPYSLRTDTLYKAPLVFMRQPRNSTNIGGLHYLLADAVFCTLSVIDIN